MRVIGKKCGAVLPLSEVPSAPEAKEEEPISSPVAESAPEEHDVPSFVRKKSVVRKIYKTRDGKVLTKEEYERMRAEMKAKAMSSDETKPSRLEGGEDER